MGDGSNLAIMTMETVLSMAASQETPISTDEDSQSKCSPPSSEGEGSSEIQANGDYNENREPKVIRITPLSLRKESESEKQATSESQEQTSSSSDEDNEDDEDHEDDLDEYELDDLPPNASIHAADEVKKKLEEIDPCEKLRSLCKKGEVDLLEEFLSKKEETGVDIDYVSGDGWTCLHEIITHGCQFVGIAKTLLKHGAEVNTKDFNQDTPIHASLLYHNTENTRILVDHGADLSIKNGIGRTPLHNANDSESLEILL